MARVTGPLHSDAARGSIKGGLTFSSWKGIAYVRQTVTPANPRSNAQTGVRCMMGFLARQWKNLTAETKATWDAIASALGILAFNVYVGENLRRWQEFTGPTQAMPAAETANALTVSAHTYTGHKGYAVLSMTPSGATNIWGFAILRDTAEITTPGWANAVAIVEANGASAVSYTDSPLLAGTYHYRIAVINKDGVIGTWLADATATVT
jgi:hypothetical protein